MLRSLSRFLQQIQGGTLKLLLLGGGVLLIWGILAPVGTLVWWLNQGSEPLTLNEKSRSPRKAAHSVDCYIVYFPGVGDYSTDQLTSGEEYFLKQLIQKHPNCVAVADVFPYSASNTSLGGQRLFAPVWKKIEQADGWLQNADVLIKIRNLWRFAISADDRYGQVYNRGIAMAVIDRMNAAHPIPPKTPLKVVLVGTSGGAQVALGAAKYLRQALDPQLYVVLMGGAFEGTVGFEAANQVYHLAGENDSIEDLSDWIFPSRWQITVGSPFNQAQQRGQYTEKTIGSHAHDGDRGYFGLDRLGNSQTRYVDITLKQVNQLPIWSAPSSMRQVQQSPSLISIPTAIDSD